jgi:hypothetical protein
MDTIVYEEMAAEESNLDWMVTWRVLSDSVLMETLQAAQADGEMHAVIAIVVAGEVTGTFVSPESAVKKQYPFSAVKQALDVYDVDGGVCPLIVRDGKAIISINGMR